MKKDACCRLCHSTQLRCVIELEKSPRCISQLLTQEMVRDDRAITLQVLKCESCGFVQAIPGIGESDYDQYVMSWMHLKTMADYRRGLCTELVGRYSLHGRKILDVGCGSGEFLELLLSCGAVACGVEPSGVLADKAREKKFQVIQDVVSAKSMLEVGPIDGFTCLQVLEHVADPVGFLKILRTSLSTSGVGFVEVPSLERIVEDRRLYEFFVDHLNYFTMGTLTMACESAGFQVLNASREFDRQFLTVCITPADLPQAETFSEMRGPLQAAREWVLSLRDDGIKVAAWGAGYKSTAAMAELDLSCIECVVDSDPAKHGLFMPVCHLPVVSPTELNARAIGAVLITAVAYKNEIVEFIRGTLGFTGRVAALGRQLEIL